MIRAKMECYSVKKTAWAEEIMLQAVTADTEENKTWSEATPSGSVELTITNKDAHGFFEPGKQYILSFVESAD